MDFNFSTGVIIGIVIGIVIMNLINPSDSQIPTSKDVVKTYSHSSYYNYNDDYGDYSSLGLHDRGL